MLHPIYDLRWLHTFIDVATRIINTYREGSLLKEEDFKKVRLDRKPPPGPKRAVMFLIGAGFLGNWTCEWKRRAIHQKAETHTSTIKTKEIPMGYRVRATNLDYTVVRKTYIPQFLYSRFDKTRGTYFYHRSFPPFCHTLSKMIVPQGCPIL